MRHWPVVSVRNSTCTHKKPSDLKWMITRASTLSILGVTALQMISISNTIFARDDFWLYPRYDTVEAEVMGRQAPAGGVVVGGVPEARCQCYPTNSSHAPECAALANLNASNDVGKLVFRGQPLDQSPS